LKPVNLLAKTGVGLLKIVVIAIYLVIHLPKCKKIIKAIKASPNFVGTLVKKLRLDYGIRSWDSASVITDLAHCCPRVEYVFGGVLNDIVSKKMAQARLDGLWQRIKILPRAVDEAHIESYIKVVMAFRSTLEKLVFSNKHRSKRTMPKFISQYNIIVEHLKEFHQLSFCPV
jgi:hypothetical protein